jgi:hypothetical protein
MSETTPVPETKSSRSKRNEVVEDAVIVEDDTATPVEVVEVETAHATENEPVVATPDPASVGSAPAPAQQVIYVQAPVAPRAFGNRGLGSLLALASGIAFGVLFALVVLVMLSAQVGRVSFNFVAQPTFYVPVLFYVIGLVLLVLLLNRAGWAAYVVGSILVGLFVYFGTVGVLVLGQGIVLMTPTDAALLFNAALRDPFVIAAALVAREVSLWSGAIIARRGRRLKARNAEARAAYERELAEKRAEHERGASAAATAV